MAQQTVVDGLINQSALIDLIRDRIPNRSAVQKEIVLRRSDRDDDQTVRLAEIARNIVPYRLPVYGRWEIRTVARQR
ncbi:hypothetical protein [Thalassospira alkalitolerans]|uniref:hypothetical protein n=1 Tax=Thalassospira alkalitolerans TaxID=1293890 RepID=UPI003AA9D4E3